MCHDYQTMFETPTHAIADIAYTLANGREHLSHRSYAVASTTTYAPGVSPSTPASKSPAVKPHVVFVFTGQGAAWPQMARDLILSNPTFARTIDSLDKHLGLLGADWTLRDELLKPARTSRVYNAEFSQPLCTALQLGLIDVLAHIGVLPQAVVGHSSGEIAAAYAAGALTAKEAIAVAFHRGAVTKGQTETGGMAAVGLGSDEVQQYLVPGVTMACDNSPSSVTLSGDADKLTDVMARISQARPDVPVTRLKVDKAYHSHHMTAFGEAYHQTMLGSSVVGSLPTIPFFSSVTGGLLGNTKNNRLTPRYWQSNLERPVLFKDAVQAILKSSVVENPILLELGPHSALAGPLRQNLAATSSNAVYIASLLRRQNNRENLLHTIGKLYTSYVALDFGALVTNPASLVAGLPRYPWDHAQRFWYESRLCKEWLDKKHVHHPLLGLQVTTSSEMEPSWRNLLSPKYTPWIAHHKLGDLIVFPLAGFVSVAAEAGRQVSGIDDGVSIRNLTVHNALVIDGESPTELVTTLRRERLTDTLASTWWEFTISSYNGHTWTKHTTGEVRGETLDSQSPCTEESPRLPRKVDSNNFYEAVRQEGLDYGPSFHTMRNVRTDTKSMTGTTTIQNNQWGDEEHYHVHPVVLDTYFQLMSCAIVKGIGRDYQRMVAAKIELITMFRCVEDELHIFNAAEGSSEGYIANGWVSAGVKKALNISGSHCHIFHEDTIIENPISSAARSTWVRHIDFQDNRKLIREPLSHVKCIPLLDELALIAIALLSRATQGTDVHVPRLVKFKEWLSQNSPSHLADVDVASLIQQVESLAKKLENTPAAALASTITTITRSIDSILRGETIDDHGVMMGFLREHDDKDYLRASAYTKPNMGVLILGVEPEDDISGALDCFRRADGQALCSQIVIASGSASSSNTIIDKCKMAPNASISVLDVNNDLAEQGFENQQFDLIIARNVLSASEDIPRSLQNVHRLLRPNGMLLLQEPRPGLLWANLISGTLSHPWSNAEDLDRISEPFISAEAWQEALLSAGFSGIDYVKSTSEHWPNHILTARPRAAETPSKKLTVLAHSAKFAETHCIVTELMNRGYTIDCRSLGESLPSGQDIVALLEEGQPFFDDGDAVKFSQLQSLLQDVGDNGIFWITRLSSVACKNPKYAQIVGLARAVRSETAIDFAVLETEQVISGTNVSAVISVLDKFQTREDDGLLGPDYEFAIHNGETLVHRIFPFSIEDEKVVQQELSEAIVTQQHPGRLNSLTWSSRSPVLPQDDEIEVAIHATGLNFKDVLVGMQIIPGKEPKFGGEASGVVRRVGPKVTRVAVGDRVCGIGEHLLSTTALCPEIYFEKLPERLSFIEGACIPMVFVTALYGLRDIGRLSKGQSVLIHCGAGGVGLAAIQVARLLGAEIYTTVGSEDKVKCLTDTCNVPRERIFNSRDSSFVQGVLRETNGRGVDVVLNSLAGELLHATWKCVARWGTMVEIGKRDILGNGRLDMSPFLDNRSYSCFDIHLMGRERPELLNQLLKFVMDCFDQGQFEPIRVDKVFPASQTLDAVRYMQQGKHIGKIVIEIQDRVGHRLIDEVDTNKKIDAGLDSTGSYLLVGGLGGLGRTMAVWMAQRGARFFIFLSRSAGTGPHDLDLVVELESMGCHIQLVRGDVSEPSDVARAVGGRVAPLRGVIQMSMVLRDQMFDGMSFEDWNVVVNPKVKGTWNLHNATIASGCDLDFFVLFSSLSGIVGQVGQANYASANTFLDAFVHYRVAQNLPCTAIDLGAVGGIGYLADNPDLFKKMQGTGWSVVQETELLDALPLAFMSPTIRSQRSQGIAMGDTFILGLAPTVPLSSPNSSARLKRDVRIAAYHNMDRNDNKAQSSTPDTLGAFLAASKKDPSLFKSTETVELLGREVGKKLCSLVLADDTDLSMTANVSDLGLDSLVAVEMRGWWKLTFGFDISTLDMLGLGTLESMGKRLAEQFITKYNV
jgi:acyl transferase domain-containing protein/NADPH:quinone reductase-like Zn-dependent oxidoreductase